MAFVPLAHCRLTFLILQSLWPWCSFSPRFPPTHAHPISPPLFLVFFLSTTITFIALITEWKQANHSSVWTLGKLLASCPFQHDFTSCCIILITKRNKKQQVISSPRVRPLLFVLFSQINNDNPYLCLGAKWYFLFFFLLDFFFLNIYTLFFLKLFSQWHTVFIFVVSV